MRLKGVLGASMLCRTYAMEIVTATERDVVPVSVTRVPEQPKVCGQDPLLVQTDKVWQLLLHDALLSMCGAASHLEPDVRQLLAEGRVVLVPEQEGRIVACLLDLPRESHGQIPPGFYGAA